MKKARLVGLIAVLVFGIVRCQQASHSSVPPKALPGAVGPTGGGGTLITETDPRIPTGTPPGTRTPPVRTVRGATPPQTESTTVGGASYVVTSGGGSVFEGDDRIIPTDGPGEYVRGNRPVRRSIAPPAPDSGTPAEIVVASGNTNLPFASYQENETPIVVNWFAGFPHRCDICECHGNVCLQDAPPPAPSPIIVSPQPAPLPIVERPRPQPAPAPAARQEVSVGPFAGGSTGDGIKNLDVIFVAYSSPSMDDVRTRVVSQVDKFIERLPVGARVNFGILPAHCMDSARRRASDAIDGQIFKLPNEPEAWRVLSTSVMSGATIKQKLIARMIALKNYRDPSDCEGETGLISVFRTLHDEDGGHTQFHNLVDAGMYNNDAALMLVFMANEADSCYFRGPGDNGPGANDQHDIDTRIKYCVWDQYARRAANGAAAQGEFVDAQAGTEQGRRLDYNALAYYLKKVKTVNGVQLPIIIAPFIYPTDSEIPDAHRREKYGKEYEAGHGYIELNAIFGGPVVNLKNREGLGAGLVAAADHAKFSMIRYQTSIRVQQEHIGRVVPKSVSVLVRLADGSTRVIPNFRFNPSTGVAEIKEKDIAAVASPGAQLFIQYKIYQ